MFDSDGEGRQLKVLTLATRALRQSFVTGDATARVGNVFGDADGDSRSLHEFNKLVGPIRAFNGSVKPLEYVQLFYSDNVFAKIADFTNGNARNKFNRARRRLVFCVAHGRMMAPCIFVAGRRHAV